MKEKYMKNLVNMSKTSEQREKLIAAQGQIAFLKAKLSNYERSRSKSIRKETFNEYGYVGPAKSEKKAE